MEQEKTIALANVAELVERQPMHQRVTGWAGWVPFLDRACARLQAQPPKRGHAGSNQ